MELSRIVKLMAVVLGGTWSLDLVYWLLEAGSHLQAIYYPSSIKALVIFFGLLGAFCLEMLLFWWTGTGAILGESTKAADRISSELATDTGLSLFVRKNLAHMKARLQPRRVYLRTTTATPKSRKARKRAHRHVKRYVVM
jgi:hypothetical protein